MPIDYRIPAAVKPFSLNITESIASFAKERRAREREVEDREDRAQQRIDRATARTERDEDRADRAVDRTDRLETRARAKNRDAVFTRNLGDYGKTAAELAPTDAEGARLATAAGRTAERQQRSDADDDVQHELKKLSTITQMLGGVTDQPSYDKALAWFTKNKIDTSQLNPTYVDTEVQGHIAEGMDLRERMAMAAAKLKAEGTRTTVQTKDARGNPIQITKDNDGNFFWPDGTVTKSAPTYERPRATGGGAGGGLVAQEVEDENGNIVTILVPRVEGLRTKVKESDNPKLPRKVEDYIAALSRQKKGERLLTRAEAEAQFDSTDQRGPNPALSATEVAGAFDRFFGKPGDKASEERLDAEETAAQRRTEQRETDAKTARVAARTTPAAPAAAPARAPAPAAKPKAAKARAVGDPVMYKGKSYRIKAIVNGEAVLE